MGTSFLVIGKRSLIATQYPESATAVVQTKKDKKGNFADYVGGSVQSLGFKASNGRNKAGLLIAIFTR